VRLGLIGDVHAEDVRLEVALARLGAERVDRLLCTGDIVDGQGDVDRACALLEAHRVATVRGNHDRWIREDTMRDLPHAHVMTALAPRSIALLKTLPPTLRVDTPMGQLLLGHGVAERDMARLGPNDTGYGLATNDALLGVLFDASVSILVGGHTHEAYVRRFERGAAKPPLVVVNAGTLARDDAPGFVLLDLGARRVDFFSLGPACEVTLRSRAVL